MAHYFTNEENLVSEIKKHNVCIDSINYYFYTDNGVFSKKNIDYGSYLLIKNVYLKNLGSSLLDLGSGYGPIGIIIKHFNPELDVEMVDVNSRATELAVLNCQKNKVNIKVHLCEDILTLNRNFDTVTLNPPIRAGKKVIYDLYAKSRTILNDGGSLYIVIQKKQGAKSSIKELETLFKNVVVIDSDGGYLVIEAHN